MPFRSVLRISRSGSTSKSSASEMSRTGSGQHMPTDEPQSKPQKLSDLKSLLNIARQKESAALRAYVEGKQLGEKFKVDAARMQQRDPNKTLLKEKHSMTIDSASMRMRQTWRKCEEEFESINDVISRREKALTEAEGDYLEAGHTLDVARVSLYLASVGGIEREIRLREMHVLACASRANLLKKILTDLRIRWL